MVHSSVKFVFFGTSQISVEILECLKKHGLVPSLVVTNSDRAQGRKLVAAPPPAKLWAIANNIPFLQPESLSDSVFLQKLEARSCQLFVVVAYGKIIPKKVLAISAKGALNLHYSLLPKYRGASPIESQILNDDNDNGVTIMLVDEKMDHGPVVAYQKLNTRKQKWQWPPKASELRRAMNELGGKMLAETVPKWVEGKIEAKPQDHSKATYAKKFAKADGQIDLAGDPYRNFLKIQAFDDSIGTYFYIPTGSPLTREAPSPACVQTSAGKFAEGTLKSSVIGDLLEPSTARQADPAGFFKKGEIKGKPIRVLIKSAVFREGKLVIVRVVPEGKKEMSYEEFLRGYDKKNGAPR